MNDKQKLLNKIIDTVVDCCNMDGDNPSVTRETVLGTSRTENNVMTRAILVHQIISAGFSCTTCAILLNRTEPSIRHLIDLGYDYLRNSKAYRIANAEATLKCKDII